MSHQVSGMEDLPNCEGLFNMRSSNFARGSLYGDPISQDPVQGIPSPRWLNNTYIYIHRHTYTYIILHIHRYTCTYIYIHILLWTKWPNSVFHRQSCVRLLCILSPGVGIPPDHMISIYIYICITIYIYIVLYIYIHYHIYIYIYSHIRFPYRPCVFHNRHVFPGIRSPRSIGGILKSATEFLISTQ